MRRVSRNLLFQGLGWIAFGLLILISNSRYIQNAFCGPLKMNTNQLLAVSNPDSLNRYYVNIDCSNVSMANNLASPAMYGNLYGLTIADHVLFAEIRADIPSQQVLSARHFEGELRNQKPPVQTVTMPDGKKLPVLPFTLRVADFSFGAWLVLLFGIPAILAGLSLSVKAKKRMDNLDTHPTAKQLATLAEDPAELGRSISAEMDDTAAAVSIGPAVITRNWLVITWMLDVRVIRLADIAWIYEHRTTYISVMPPAFFRTHCIAIRTSDKKGHEIPLSSNRAEAILSQLTQRAPWAVAGFSEQSKSRWTRETDAFIAEVQSRKSS